MRFWDSPKDVFRRLHGSGVLEPANERFSEAVYCAIDASVDARLGQPMSRTKLGLTPRLAFGLITTG
jgi:hypothetical protein